MRFIFSTNQIAELSNKPLRERHELIQKAEAKFTAPEKLLLNLLKLVMLLPPFFLLGETRMATVIGLSSF